ncbi:MAG: hypothetical protein JXR40_00055 [Pontiellaceae bacterium]|nr:hypothetical protein [Pontiellaceae bacterium]
MKTRLFAGLIALTLLGCDSTSMQDYNAKKYCQALNAANYESFKVLYSEKRQNDLTEEMFNAMDPLECRLESFSMPYAFIHYKPRVGDEQSTTLYLYPSGKIKYDPIFFRHPALKLRAFAEQLEHEDLTFRQAAFNHLTAWNVPTFGYDPELDPFIQIDRVEQLREWVDENEATFDVGDPKIPLSPIDLQWVRMQEYE